MYETNAGRFDLQYYFLYTTQMHDSLSETLREFGDGFRRYHDVDSLGLSLQIGDPTDFEWTEMGAARPATQPTPYFQPP